MGNRDDHLRNHGFLRGAHGSHLAPAFDINPNPEKVEHAIALDEASRIPSVAAVRRTHEFYRLSKAAAAQIEAEVSSSFRGLDVDCKVERYSAPRSRTL